MKLNTFTKRRPVLRSLQHGLLVGGVMLLSTTGCQDILKEEVISQIGNDYLNTPAGLEDGVKAAYSSLRSWYGTEQGNNLTVFGTDTYTNGSDGSWKFMNQYTSQFDPRNGQLNSVWDEFYRAINTCNAVLGRAPGVAGVSEAIKKQRIAETKFLRAHYYFLLVQTFGGVDLRLTETLAPTKTATRASEADVYKVIVADLESAIPDLEAKAKSVQYGRATRPAAEHLLAKVYLTKATSSAKAADDYAKAETLLQSVVKNYGFRLLPDFGKVYEEGNEINDEIIFATQYTKDPLTNDNGNNTHVFFLMEYDVLPGMERDVANGRPFKRYRPTDYTLNVVFKDRVNDSRYKKSFKDTYLSNKPGTYNTNFDKSKATVKFAAGDTAIYLPGFEMSVAERAKKPYQVLTPSLYTEKLFPALTKHLDGQRADKTVFAGSRDYVVMRLADTYLLLAEAQIMQNKATLAAENINMVRRRAAFPGKAAAMEITPAQATMNFIYDERARELIGEQERWFDLKRWGNLITRVKQYNDQAAPNIQPYHVLRPIPQTQIDRVEGGISAFPQNPGF